jgi:putative PIN family toxin of toxin-antitoxin system
VRVVLDPNVLVSAAISPSGPPREILSAWLDGRFELVASPALLDELEDVVARPKFRRWISTEVTWEFIEGLADAAVMVDDPPTRPELSPDPDDDYLIALARAVGADYLASGDPHLLDLDASDPPVLSKGPDGPRAHPRAAISPPRRSAWRRPGGSSPIPSGQLVWEGAQGAMSHTAIAAALACEDLATGERLVAFSLASFTGPEHQAFPGTSAAAARAGLKPRAFPQGARASTPAWAPRA